MTSQRVILIDLVILENADHREVSAPMGDPKLRPRRLDLFHPAVQFLFGDFTASEPRFKSFLLGHELFSQRHRRLPHLVAHLAHLRRLVRGQSEIARHVEDVGRPWHSVQFGRLGKSPAAAAKQFLDVLMR
jgi:hypothetical protein